MKHDKEIDVLSFSNYRIFKICLNSQRKFCESFQFLAVHPFTSELVRLNFTIVELVLGDRLEMCYSLIPLHEHE